MIFNGIGNKLNSNNTNFNKINNGHNNTINGRQVNSMNNHLNVNNNFSNSSFNININNRDLNNFSPQLENLISMVTGFTNNFNFNNSNFANFNFGQNSNNNNFNNNNMNNFNYNNYSDNENEESEYEEESEDEEFNEEEEENEENKKKKILLDLNEFQYKHAKKYIKRIDDKCAICLETYKGTDIVKQFACGQHIFHKKCLIILCKKSNKCPLCKYDLMNGIKPDNTLDD